MKTLLDKYEPLLKILIAVLLVFFIFYPDGKESEQIGRSINLENIEEAYDIRNDVMILKDPESNFEIGDISQAPGSWGFMPVDLKKLGSDFGASVFGSNSQSKIQLAQESACWCCRALPYGPRRCILLQLQEDFLQIISKKRIRLRGLDFPQKTLFST